LWFVGLPGSGKSSVARAVAEALRDRGIDVVYLEMDARRKVYFPTLTPLTPLTPLALPSYSSEERTRAYGLFVREAAGFVEQGRGVIMDGTAHRVSLRHTARKLIPRFAEVYVRCSLDVAMARERARPGGLVMAGLYAKALDRRRTGREYPGLGEVIGVDAPFEEDPGAECVVDSEHMSVLEARDLVLEFFDQWMK